MRNLLLAIAGALCLAACSCQKAPQTHQQTETHEARIQVGDYALGTPIVSGNAVFVPVLSTKPQNELIEYVLLAEATQRGWVEIIEKPGQREVSFLRVKYSGPRSLLLISGDLLLGGKQDRIVAKDTIIPPGKEMDIEVYCVEHGRWSGPSDRFKADVIVPDSVRRAAAKESQQEVWDSVSEFNNDVNALPNASTVGAGIDTKQVKERMLTGIQDVEPLLAGHREAVGFIFALAGEVKTLEIFASPQLFQSARKNLLKGYLAEASRMEGGSKPVTLEACADFLRNALNSQIQPTDKNEVLSRQKRLGEGIRGNEILVPSLDAPVHGTYYK